MNKRKDKLRSLFAGDEVTDQTNDVTAVPAEPQRRTTSGAVRAMGIQLGALNERLSEAEQLRDRLNDGERIVEIDANNIDASPISDRLSQGAENDDAFEVLKLSLEQSGQQVPVLLRPHRDDSKKQAGFYEAAYGHRRILALRELRQPVKAIVRELSDAELVIAQGKENAERRDLSFIERATFAKALLDAGFDRATAQTALGVHKTEMTRFLQVADRIPMHLAQAIGPASKIGRPRWMALGELLQDDAARAKMRDEIRTKGFKAASSDERFNRVFERLSKPKKADSKAAVFDEDGAQIATFKAGSKGTTINVSSQEAPGFAEFLKEELPALYRRFTLENETGEGT